MARPQAPDAESEGGRGVNWKEAKSSELGFPSALCVPERLRTPPEIKWLEKQLQADSVGPCVITRAITSIHAKPGAPRPGRGR